MVRTQVQLTEEQAHALRELSEQERVSMAELIRQGVDIILHTAGEPSQKQRYQRAIAAAGRFHSGLRDLSTHHDKYLEEAYEA